MGIAAISSKENDFMACRFEQFKYKEKLKK